MKPYLLFDFDGTIADSIHPMFDLLNKLAPKLGYAPVSQDEFDLLRNMSIGGIMRHLRIPFYKVAIYMPRVLNEYRHIVHDLEPCAGMPQLLEDLSAHGVNYSILSSNSFENVHLFLQKHGITGYDWVEGTGGILNKHARIAHQISKHKLDRSKVIYIGDESRDIQAAKKCRIKVISVTWGFHTAGHLTEHEPDWLVTDPQQILEIVQGLNNNGY